MEETAATPDEPCQPSAGKPDDSEPSLKHPEKRKLSRCHPELRARSPKVTADHSVSPFSSGHAPGGFKSFDELLVCLSDAHRHQLQCLELELARVRGILVQAQTPHASNFSVVGEAANRASVRSAGGARETICPGGARETAHASRQTHRAVGPNEEAELNVPGVVGVEGVEQPQQEFSEVVSLTVAPVEAETAVVRQASKASKREWAKAVSSARPQRSSGSLSQTAPRETSTTLVKQKSRESRWSYMLVKNQCFDVLSYSLITANAVFIGLLVNRQLYCEMYGLEIEPWYDVVEIIFLCWFTSELFLKILAEDTRVFLGPDRMWNFLDLFLVFTAILQVVVDRSSEASSSFPNLSLTRNVRLFRVTRILRIIHVVRMFQSLRIMIFAILRSLNALVWVFAVLFFFMYMFAMVFMYATASHFDDYREGCPLSECLALEDHPECTATCARLTWLEANFGTLPRVMITLFQSFTGGRDWSEVYDILSEMQYILGALFAMFIYFMVFLVLNVVVGTVVDVTSGVSKRDHDSVVAEQMKKLKKYTEDIKDFFKSADTDNSGQLSYDEFIKYLKEDQVKAYFQALDLDSRQAHVLFTLLDCNESGEVGVDEFLDGCLRLKGEARNLDMNLVIYQLDHLLQRSTAAGTARPSAASQEVLHTLS